MLLAPKTPHIFYESSYLINSTKDNKVRNSV